MARETKEQKLARQTLELEATQAQEKADYPDLLMSILTRCQAVGFTIEVIDCMFWVTSKNGDKYALHYHYTPKSMQDLGDLELECYYYESLEQAARAIEAAVNAALSKLTSAEKKLLGL